MANTQTMYRIVNPDAADFYYTAAGVAYNAKGDFSDSKNPATQPTINTGRCKKLYSDRDLLNAIGEGYTRRNNGSKVMAGNDVGSAAWAASAVSITSVTAASSVAVYTLASHGLSAGDILNVTDTSSEVAGTQRVTAVTTDTFTTTKAYTSGAGTMTYYLYAGNFATMTAATYVMRRVSTTLAGISKTVLRSGAADPTNRRSIHMAQSLFTDGVATAIVAGYWNIYSGAWSTAPTASTTNAGYYSISDDANQTDGSADDAANPTASKPGELVYKEPKPLPDQDDYAERTLW